MMYEELVSKLRSECTLPYETQLMRQAADAIDELRKAVLRLEDESGLYDELPTYYIYPTKWMSVTERLPKNAGVYLCRIKSFDGEFRYTDTMKYVDGFFYERGVATERITHWMPLPEPPKEET